MAPPRGRRTSSTPPPLWSSPCTPSPPLASTGILQGGLGESHFPPMRADDDDVLGKPSSFLKASSKGLLFLAPLPLVTTVAPPPSSTSVRCWCLYFIDALLIVGDTISNAGRRHYRPSLLWGFLPPKGVGWRYAAFGCAPPVLPSARREIVVSCDVLVRLLLPTLSPHSIGNPSQFVGGWPQDGVVATGVVVALWL